MLLLLCKLKTVIQPVDDRPVKAEDFCPSCQLHEGKLWGDKLIPFGGDLESQNQQLVLFQKEVPLLIEGG